VYSFVRLLCIPWFHVVKCISLVSAYLLLGARFNSCPKLLFADLEALPFSDPTQ